MNTVLFAFSQIDTNQGMYNANMTQQNAKDPCTCMLGCWNNALLNAGLDLWLKLSPSSMTAPVDGYWP